jgi:hypothetical protein
VLVVVYPQTALESGFQSGFKKESGMSKMWSPMMSGSPIATPAYVSKMMAERVNDP